MALLKDLSKSKSDVMIGGVCGGLGAHTFIPTWIWRAGFLVALLCFGTGGLVYIILWIAMPDEKGAVAQSPAISRQSITNYLLIRHRVADFTKWKAAYDAHAPARQQAGLKEVYALRNSDKLDEVILMFEVGDIGKARVFGDSPELKEAMQNAGVVDKPDITFLT